MSFAPLVGLAYPTNGNVYPGIWVGVTNSKQEGGHKVAASLGADSVLELSFVAPPTLPSGTGKLVLLLKANATSGSVKINPGWVSLDPAAGDNRDTATFNAEGTQTVTWSAGDADDYKELKVTLDADTLVGGEVVCVELTFETASWSLATELFFLDPFIIWE